MSWAYFRIPHVDAYYVGELVGFLGWVVGRLDAEDGVPLAGWFLLDRDGLDVSVVGEVAVKGERYLAEFREPQSRPTTRVLEFEAGLS